MKPIPLAGRASFTHLLREKYALQRKTTPSILASLQGARVHYGRVIRTADRFLIGRSVGRSIRLLLRSVRSFGAASDLTLDNNNKTRRMLLVRLNIEEWTLPPSTVSTTTRLHACNTCNQFPVRKVMFVFGASISSLRQWMVKVSRRACYLWKI